MTTGPDIFFGRRKHYTLAWLHLEKRTFVKKSRKAAFEPKTFLAKVGNGKTVTEYHKDQVVFSQGSEADAVFYIQKGKIKLTVVSEQGKGSSRRYFGTWTLFWRRMSQWPSAAGHNSYGHRAIPDYAHSQSRNDCYFA